MLPLLKPKSDGVDRLIRSALTELHETKGLVTDLLRDDTLSDEDKATRIALLKTNVAELKAEITSLRQEKITVLLPALLYSIINKQSVFVDISGDVREYKSLEAFISFLLLDSSSYKLYDISFQAVENQESIVLVYIL